MASSFAESRLAFNLWNLASYQAGWFACVLGAASGRSWIGPLAVLALAAAHVALVEHRLREIWLLTLCAAFGLGVDSFQAYLGAFHFLDPWSIPWLAPIWLVAVWVIFATTLHGCLAWMQGRYLLGAVLGLIGGPLSYWGGQKLGAVSFGADPVRDLAVIAVVWAFATPVLLLFARLTHAPLAKRSV